MTDKEKGIGNREFLLSEIVNVIPGVVFQLYARPDGAMGFYYISPQSEQIIGLNPELEWCFERLVELIVPEQRDDFIKSIEKSLKEAAAWKYEGMLQKHSGENIWFSCNATLAPREDEVVFNGILQDITARKKAEELLEGSEEKFRCIVECSPIAKYFYRLESDDRLILTGANPSADRIIGIRHQDLIGKTIEEAFPQLASSDIPSMYRKIARGLLGNQSFEITYKDERFSGHYEVTVFQAGVGQIVVDFVDISGRKKAAQALRESEEKFRLLHENSGIGIGYFTPEGTVLSFNRLAANHMNGAPEYFTGKSIYELFPKPAAELYYARLKKACLADESMVYEDLVPLPAGNKFFLSTITKITNSEGKILGIQILSQDISNLKCVEKELSESEARFRSVFEQSPVGAVFVGFDKRFIRCNQAFCSFLGYEECELIRKTISDITYPDDVELGMKELKMIAEGKLNSFSVEKRYVRKDGVLVWGEACISLVRDATGKPSYFLPVIKDISDRKKVEEEHLKYEQQLQLNQKLESLGVLAGGIAHDFNNLLGGIYGYIDLAYEASKDKYVSQYLAKTMSTIERARALTHQLLTFAKGGAPVQVIAPLFPFVQEAQFALSGSNVSCSFEIPTDIWNCNYDRNQIGQVIDNLIINAQQAMPAGGTIALTARNVALYENEHPTLVKGDYVRISIKDSGVGIPKDLLTRIFDPFFTTKTKGHGLGLATCYSIINRHGGCVNVYSEPGKGSVFHVYLPASSGTVKDAEKGPAKEHKGSGMVLVMDDELVMRETISDMLSSFGYTVVCKENGQDAVDYVVAELKSNRQFSGMIFDLTVPAGMGGKDAVSEIRKFNTTVPIFVASGYADDPVMKNPVEYGFTASISKPFRRIELIEMFARHIKSGN